MSFSNSSVPDKETRQAFIGIVIAIVGNVFVSLGLNLQRYAHVKIDRDEGEKPYLQSKLWWLGLLVMSTGEIGNFLAYGWTSATIVAPLGTVAMISNCLIAPFLLKEKFLIRDFFGIAISITGAVIICLSSNAQENGLEPNDIIYLVSQNPFEIYMAVTFALIVFLCVLSNKYGKQFILVDLGLVALFGGYTVLSTKGFSSLLSLSYYHIFTFWISYVLVSVLVITAVLQIKYLNRALSNFDSRRVIPTQFVLFTISVIIGSAVLYRDFEKASGTRISRFVIGCLATFLGVYLVTSHHDGGNDSIKEEDDESSSLAPSSASSPSLIPARPSLSVIKKANGSSRVAQSQAGESTPLLTTPSARRSSQIHVVGNTPILGYSMHRALSRAASRDNIRTVTRRITGVSSSQQQDLENRSYSYINNAVSEEGSQSSQASQSNSPKLTSTKSNASRRV